MHRPRSIRPLSCLRPHGFSSFIHRDFHLAPPFLLDDYTPRYQLLSSIDASKKRSSSYAHLRNCNLCPRLCGVNRYERTGACLIGAETVTVNVIAPHFGEEPCVQGHSGSGSVFFSGCNLRCVFCQNHDIAHQKKGFNLTPEDLGEWYMKLQTLGNVHNINLITPEHVVPQVVLSILHARDLGLNIPIIYNTSAFNSLKSIELLDGLKDTTSKRLLKVDRYTEAAMESIKAMHAQVGDLCFTPDGIAKKGLLVRHLVMPGYETEGEEIMRSVAENVSRDVFVNIMEQYRPDAHVGKPKRPRRAARLKSGDKSETSELVRYPEINRPVSEREISAVRQSAEKAGLWRFCDPPRHDGFAL
ncbi:hypothetical protein BJ875DRAFT_437402 [Amylocarpus encephaloides]|uniref:Radical SAM core domain-containing protein n=1 Tax=Amylocarpus encephaloides TaxID=45428 RepID=A0A9P8C943_9HELO|nr:hypothetical protein BJ875DRAFT_437402 [Amylocarpus encephaloides]